MMMQPQGPVPVPTHASPWIQQLRASTVAQARAIIERREQEDLQNALNESFESTPAAFEAAPDWKIAALRRKIGLEITCRICLEQTGKREIVAILPCTHEFHNKCVEQWLRVSGVCPLCKVRL